MVAYRAFDIKAVNDEHKETKLSHNLLESVLMTFKMYWRTADTDSKWILDIVNTMRKPTV